MKAESSAKLRAYRILRQMERYRAIQSPAELPSWVGQDSFVGAEQVIGVYENTAHSDEDSIVITTHGLYFRAPAAHYVRYSEIRDVSVAGPKTDAREITIDLRNGERLKIAVRGGTGRLRDAFELLRFLRRVTEDWRAYSR